MTQYFQPSQDFELESGEKLSELKIAYNILGNPLAEKTIWVCHALSGNSVVTEWWPGLFGTDQVFQLSDFKIICANVIGSCYGSTSASELTDSSQFPLITVKDQVSAHVLLREHLGIEQVEVLIGASLGGQQAIEWAIKEVAFAKNLILIACNAIHSSFGKAFNEAQRLCLEADPTFREKEGGREGLKAARAVAMLSYRSYKDFEKKQVDITAKLENYNATSYIRHQGSKFADRFKAEAYFTLTKTMDSHDVGRGRASLGEALALIQSRTLIVGVNSDLLFPIAEQEFLVQNIPNADLGIIDSLHGHDAFLIEYEQLSILIDEFLNNAFKAFKPTIFKPQLVKDEK
jgi:homoserine O-acetyltransferase/O-succinyltransferase